MSFILFGETVKEFISEKVRVESRSRKNTHDKGGGKEHNNSGDDEINGGKNKDNEGEKQTGKGGIHRRQSDKKRKGGVATHKKGS